MFIGVGEDGERGSDQPSSIPAYDEAMDALSSLISQKSRADPSNSGLKFGLLFDYVKVDTTKTHDFFFFEYCNFCLL